MSGSIKSVQPRVYSSRCMFVDGVIAELEDRILPLFVLYDGRAHGSDVLSARLHSSSSFRRYVIPSNKLSSQI